MFCPKCGTNVPDGSRFCPSCGNTFNRAPGKAAPMGMGQAPFRAPSAGGGFNTMQLVSIGVSVLALIFAFLPWLSASASFGASGYGVYKNSGSLSVFSFLQEGEGFFTFIFIFWLIAILLIIAGALMMLFTQKHSKTLFIVGNVVLALVAIIWIFIVVIALNTYNTSGSFLTLSASFTIDFPIFALLCCIASIASVVLTVLSKKSGA